MSNIRTQLAASIKKMSYNTDRLSATSLLTMQPYINASRMIIFNHNIPHAQNLINPEVPKVYGGFEYVLGQYSRMLDRAEEDFVIKKIFKKNKYTHLFLLYDEKNNKYHIQKREPGEIHSEHCATLWDNKVLDNLEVGDKIEKGDVLRKSRSIDDHGNYRLGVNLNQLYQIQLGTEEDATILMNDAHKLLAAAKGDVVPIHISLHNNIFLNLFGDKNHYKPLPKVGEELEDGILAATRKINNANIVFAAKDKALMHIDTFDEVYYASGRVVDIDLYYNGIISDIESTPINEPIIKMLRKQNKYYMELYRELGDIINDYKEGLVMIDASIMEAYNKSRKFCEATSFFSTRGDAMFGHIIAEFTVLEKDEMKPGSKMAGLHANKGVISQIRSKEESYMTESGRPVHVIMDALGVVGRLNFGQLFYGGLTALGLSVQEELKTQTSIKDKKKTLIKLMELIDAPDKDYLKEYLDELDDKEIQIFFNKVERNGIHIMQDPTLPSTVLDVMRAEDKFPIIKERIVFPDGSKSIRPVVVSENYTIRLKQDF
jgi:hypothetical protein